ncbi:hypothetical protein NCER_101608 [Vairimorpha ceranae BRL01]|uniref:Uncharacterized protein n=1 Tax=Vairimorpha ceranae (strain BRL01) TaxID=578460 RepID=C4VAE2_VAIC1|nr:hypothetical protein NCER_101608 [Vairimorpha ceranae BRL01]
MIYLFFLFYFCSIKYEILDEESSDEYKNNNYMKNKFNGILNIGRTENLDVGEPSRFLKEGGKNVIFKNAEEKTRARGIYRFYLDSINLLKNYRKLLDDEMELIYKEYNEIYNRFKFTRFYFSTLKRIKIKDEISPEDYGFYKCCFRSMHFVFCCLSSDLRQKKRQIIKDTETMENEKNSMSGEVEILYKAFCDFLEESADPNVEDFSKYLVLINISYFKYYTLLLYMKLRLEKVVVYELNEFDFFNGEEGAKLKNIIYKTPIFKLRYEAFKEYNFYMKPLLEVFKILINQHILETEKFYKLTKSDRDYLLSKIKKKQKLNLN